MTVIGEIASTIALELEIQQSGNMLVIRQNREGFGAKIPRGSYDWLVRRAFCNPCFVLQELSCRDKIVAS